MTLPSRSKIMNRVLVVPWSIAPTNLVIFAHPLMRGLDGGVARGGLPFGLAPYCRSTPTRAAHALRADACLQSVVVLHRSDHATMLEHKRDKRSGRSLIAFVFREG